MPSAVLKRLTPEDLSRQEGLYFAGCQPGGSTPTLWQFVERKKDSAGASVFLFEDCYIDSDTDLPLTVPFTLTELQRNLRLVRAGA